MDQSVSPKEEIWFLCVCHHISSGLYNAGSMTSLMPINVLREIKEERNTCIGSRTINRSTQKQGALKPFKTQSLLQATPSSASKILRSAHKFCNHLRKSSGHFFIQHQLTGFYEHNYHRTDPPQLSQYSDYATGLKDLGFESGQGKDIFLFSRTPTLALQPTQPLFRRVQSALCPGTKRLGSKS